MSAAPAAIVAATGEEPSFADQVRGLDAQHVDKTLARLMDDLYDMGPGVDGWKPLDAAQLEAVGIDPATLKNEDSGFLSRIYGDGAGHYVIAYSGTDEGKDWLTNLRQGLGLDDAQYNQAVALAREAKVAFGDQVVITGHSLGGGLAGTASIATGIPAVTFNASGVHDKTLERLGIDADRAKAEVAENGQIRRYAVNHEILTELQEHSIPLKWAMPDAVGHKIELPDPDPQTFWQRLIPGNGIKHGIDLHYIDSVIKAQDKAMPETTPTRAVTAAPNTSPAGSQPGDVLYDQALRGLHAVDPRQLDFRSEQGYRNAAANASFEARAHGLERIDHVVPSTNGNGFFMVQGGLDDPSHRRVFVDRTRAVAQPLEPSVTAPAAVAAVEPAAQTQSEPRRAMV